MVSGKWWAASGERYPAAVDIGLWAAGGRQWAVGGVQVWAAAQDAALAPVRPREKTTLC